MSRTVHSHKLLPYLLVFVCVWVQSTILAQNYFVDTINDNFNNNVTWCTTSEEEQNKCLAFSLAVERDINAFGEDFKKIVCKLGANRDDCMNLLDGDNADLTVLDPGEVFIGGRYHSLIPILQEVYASGETYYYSVAVVKRGSLQDVQSLKDLRNKKACFAGVGTLAGWVIPIYTLMKEGGLEIFDCNNHVKSAIEFFGPSCAVNSLIDKYNPIGDNSDKLCKLCGGTVTGIKCTPKDPYYGYEGAFKCLIEKGDVAFLKHTTIPDTLSKPADFIGVRKDQFELLCPDGSRRPIDDFVRCNWGRSPSDAVVTSSVKPGQLRRVYQRFLRKAARLYGSNFNSSFNNQLYPGYQNPNNPFGNYNPNVNHGAYEQFKLFESVPKYGFRYNLIFQDNTNDLKALEEHMQTYSEFLQESLKVILGIRECTVNKMTLCVTSEAELEKCIKMKVAMKAQLLKPEMNCFKDHSQISCMQSIRNGNADVAVFDAGDIYTAGLNYELVPFMSEIYNLGKPEYYVVAVAKEEDPDTDLTYLRGKNTCHTGINMGAGWVIPLAFLISNEWIRNYGCNSIRAAAEYFTKSCIPGALSSEYNNDVPYDNMCDLCHGSSFKYCRRDASEDYFGHTGAFRCLVEGGGDVAFVKHTTVFENADGKRKEFWARNTLRGDFELLCPDGKRGQVEDYKRCALGKVKANAIVTRGGYGYNETEIKAYTNLFLYAQQFYGSKDIDDFSFSMFSSPSPYSDLIFQDAATQLQVIPREERHYGKYLGKDFLRAKRIVDCQASVDKLHTSIFTLILALICLRLS